MEEPAAVAEPPDASSREEKAGEGTPTTEETQAVAAPVEEVPSAMEEVALVQPDEKETLPVLEDVVLGETEAAPVKQMMVVAEEAAERTTEAARAVDEEGLLGSVQRQAVGPTEQPALMGVEAPEAPTEGKKAVGVAPEVQMAEANGELVVEPALALEKGAAVEEEVVVAAIVGESSVEAAPVVEIVDEEEAAVGSVEAVVEGKDAPKHSVFLSHSGEQKAFVEHLRVELEVFLLYPFLDIREDSLPYTEKWAKKISDAIEECHVGVVVLSEKFFTSRWPMMELAAMVDKEKKMKNGSFKILPVFYSISPEDIRKKRSGWVSVWNKLFEEEPKGVDVGKWGTALDHVCSINGPKRDGRRDLQLEIEIVNVIGELVPAEIRTDDSHIQGRDRLCKVIEDKIDECQISIKNGICMVGLYGMHGIGKTSICKALCKKYFLKFPRRVCHVELERGTEEELMRRLVKQLTSGTSKERLNEFKLDELHNMLKGGTIKDAVFLVIDNMIDDYDSIERAKRFLSASFPPGSIVMVTAHSGDCLKKLRPYLDEGNCLEMPELNEGEARSLFANSSGFTPRNARDEKLVDRCIELCYFQKDDGIKSYHYHPLALDVLGRQLGRIDPRKWGAQLDKIDKDIFNPSNEGIHPVFSILRQSFDLLCPEDQLLYMDIALFLPDCHPGCVWEWLCMVHSFPNVDDLMSRLQGLKSKSLLESLGDGMTTSIGMHDLSREFCKAETKCGKLKHRRWVYEAVKRSELVDTSPSGTCWADVKRMAFLDPELGSLERVNFYHFPSVTVLKIIGIKMKKKVVLDLSGLTRLKSLEIVGSNLERLSLVGLPRGLGLLSLVSGPDYWGLIVGAQFSRKPMSETGSLTGRRASRWSSPTLIKQIECLEDLYNFGLVGYGGSKLPDMRRMVSLRSVGIYGCENVVTLRGLNSKLSSLQGLRILHCRKLRSCPGVGDLVNLVVLDFTGCVKLKSLPNLQKLRNLRILDIRMCPLITEVPGLGDLESLEQLCAGSDSVDCGNHHFTIKLPDMRKLSKLRSLGLRCCLVTAVSGLENLTSLEKLSADFQGLADKPSFCQLTKLQVSEIWGWSSEGLEGLQELEFLRHLFISECRGVDALLSLHNLQHLDTLHIEDCDFTNLSSCSSLIPLTITQLGFLNCINLQIVPDLQRFSNLEGLAIKGCPIESMTISGVLFPRLSSLALNDCKRLERLESHEQPMNFLQVLAVEYCGSLTTLPAFCNKHFPALEALLLSGCSTLRTLSITEPLTTLELLCLDGCSSVELLDPKMFPALRRVSSEGCSGLKELNIVCLTPLTVPDVRSYRSLLRDDMDRLEAFYPEREIERDELDGVVKTRTWKIVWAAGISIVMVALGWVLTTRRSRARKY